MAFANAGLAVLGWREERLGLDPLLGDGVGRWVEVDAAHDAARAFDIVRRRVPLVIPGALGAMVLWRFDAGFAQGGEDLLLAVFVRVIQRFASGRVADY